VIVNLSKDEGAKLNTELTKLLKDRGENVKLEDLQYFAEWNGNANTSNADIGLSEKLNELWHSKWVVILDKASCRGTDLRGPKEAKVVVACQFDDIDELQ
jgi:hypothetical protein